MKNRLETLTLDNLFSFLLFKVQKYVVFPRSDGKRAWHESSHRKWPFLDLERPLSGLD